MNAQALRFLEFLSQNTITSKVGSITVALPHPANFALHKLLVMSRRPKTGKQAKDKEAGIRILTPNVFGGRYIGEMVGANYGTIANCYATDGVKHSHKSVIEKCSGFGLDGPKN